MTLKRRVRHIDLCMFVVLREGATGVFVVLREGATCVSVVLREGAADWFVVRGWSGSPAAHIPVLIIRKCNYNYVQEKEKRCVVGVVV